jgi:hypothetical protein
LIAIAGILAANIFSVAVAWNEHWSLLGLLWVYFIQNLIIGFYGTRRILKLGATDRDDESLLDHFIRKRQVAWGFVAAYLILHIVYFLFIFINTVAKDGHPPPTDDDIFWTAAGALAFFLAHGFSFRRNLEKDRRGRAPLDTLFIIPFARVLPMHLMLFVGVQVNVEGGIVFFGILKTIADLAMHWAEHYVLGRPRVESGT